MSYVRSMFFGFDTKLSINKLGKTQTLGKLSKTAEQRNLPDEFYIKDITFTTEEEYSVRFFKINFVTSRKFMFIFT